jgi:hypothetical protein
MAAKLTRLTHKIVIQLHLVVESCTVCSSRSRLPVRKLLDTPSYLLIISSQIYFKTVSSFSKHIPFVSVAKLEPQARAGTLFQFNFTKFVIKPSYPNSDGHYPQNFGSVLSRKNDLRIS